MEQNNKEADKEPNQIDVTAKVYPFIGKDKNRKNYYIGNYKIVLNSNDLPFSNFDQVDHMIYNLYNYAKTRKNPKDFFIYHPEKMTLIPGRMSELSMAGGRRKTNRKQKLSRRKIKKHKKTLKK
jgi:hypothetical protein